MIKITLSKEYFNNNSSNMILLKKNSSNMIELVFSFWQNMIELVKFYLFCHEI